MNRLYTRMGTALCVLMLVSAVTIFSQEHRVIVKETKAKAGAWLGVSIQDVTPELAKNKSLKSEDGAFVTSVVDESPADSAGIKKGDVIVKLGSRTIEDSDDLIKAVQKSKTGTTVSVEFLRKGEKKSVQVVLRKAPRQRSMMAIPGVPRTMQMYMMRGGSTAGLKLTDLNEQLAEYFEAPEKKGVLISEVKENSSAAKAGLKAGDVIIKVGTTRVEEPSEVMDAINESDQGDKVEIEIVRKGAKKSVTIELQEEDVSSLDMGIPFHNMEQFHISVPGVNLENTMDQLRFELEGLKGSLNPLCKDIQLKEAQEEYARQHEKVREHILMLRSI